MQRLLSGSMETVMGSRCSIVDQQNHPCQDPFWTFDDFVGSSLDKRVASLHNEPSREGLGGARGSRKAARLPQMLQRPSPGLGQPVLTAEEGSLRVQREERKGGRHSPALAGVGVVGERRAGEGEEEAQGSGCHRPERERDRRTRAAQRLKVERSELELEGSVLEAR